MPRIEKDSLFIAIAEGAQTKIYSVLGLMGRM